MLDTLVSFAIILLQSTVPVARDISQMANASQDQSMLIYVLIAAYGPLLTVIGVLWRKWESARTEVKDAATKRETLIQEHAREKYAMILENNRTSEQLGAIKSSLDNLQNRA